MGPILVITTRPGPIIAINAEEIITRLLILGQIGPERVSQSKFGSERASQSELGSERASQSEIGPERVSQSEIGPERASQSEIGSERAIQSELGSVNQKLGQKDTGPNLAQNDVALYRSQSDWAR